MNRSIALVSLAFLAAGCPTAADDDDAVATYSVTLAGTGYTPHDGMLFEAVVHDGPGMAVLAYETGTHSGDDMSITFTGVPDGDWDLFWYFDVDGNGACSAPPDDHGWDTTLSVSGGDVAVTFDHDLDWTDNCEHIHDVGSMAMR